MWLIDGILRACFKNRDRLAMHFMMPTAYRRARDRYSSIGACRLMLGRYSRWRCSSAHWTSTATQRPMAMAQGGSERDAPAAMPNDVEQIQISSFLVSMLSLGLFAASDVLPHLANVSHARLRRRRLSEFLRIFPAQQ